MGGQGSGRPPSAETLIRRSQPPPLVPMGSEMFIPNYSGIQPAAKKDSTNPLDASKVVVTDANKQLASTGDATFTGTLTIDQNSDAYGIDIDSEATTKAGLRVYTMGGNCATLSNEAGGADTEYAHLCKHNNSDGSFFFKRDLAAADTAGPVLKIIQDNTGDDQIALNVQQDGTGIGIQCDQNNNARALNIDKDVTNAANSTQCALFYNTSVVNDAGTYAKNENCVEIVNNVTETSGTITDTSITLAVSNTHADATGAVVDVNNDGKGHGIYVHQDGVSDASKYGLYVYSNAAQTNTPLAYVLQDNASSTTAALEVEQDGNVEVLALDQDYTSAAFIDYQGTSAADATKSISSWTNATIAGFVKVEINGTAYWMPYYNAPTS